jgi:hypothetical protein
MTQEEMEMDESDQVKRQEVVGFPFGIPWRSCRRIWDTIPKNGRNDGGSSHYCKNLFEKSCQRQ